MIKDGTTSEVRNLLLILIFFSGGFSAFAQSEAVELSGVIPHPNTVVRLKGEFKFNRETKIVANKETGKRTGRMLNELLQKSYGLQLELVSLDEKPNENFVAFLPASTLKASGNSTESYRVIVTPRAVQIIGDEAGMFYGSQSMWQLLSVDHTGHVKIPAVDITDAPRFQYRGMHLDVARHFFPVETVKNYIDLMARYKLNYFHWHLTDDQGWRIEIKKYPRLTQVGAYRSETQKGKNFIPFVGDGIPHGGYYTQEQIREIVAYAKTRHIIVMPEIEMPGHNSAAVAAYPELSCKPNQVPIVSTRWGSGTDAFCPTERTFNFLEDVLAETIALFPNSPYIHIGGDEVTKRHWQESSFVQKLKKRERLKDEQEVQSYFIRRIERFINSKGKKMIGWDEIVEGGLAPNATVMSWRQGEQGGITAAKAGHDVIMATKEYLYMNYGQGDPQYEPVHHAYHLPLAKVYAYDPVPKVLDERASKSIIGVQGNLWTEYVKTPEQIEYQILPRMLAVSEIAWSLPKIKNFDDFQRRLQQHYVRFDKENINYRIPEPAGLRNVILGNRGSARFDLRSQIAGAKIFYTTDGSDPTEQSKLYAEPFEVFPKSNEAMQVKTIVVNAMGRKSSIYAALVISGQAFPSTEIDHIPKSGVNAQFFRGNFQSLAEINSVMPTETDDSPSISLGQFSAKTDTLKNPFGARFQAYIYVPKGDVYEFRLETDDTANLIIDSQEVVKLDGITSKHARPGKQITTGVIALAKGFHRFNLSYIQRGGDAVLDIFWGVKGEGLQRIIGSELFH